MLELESCEHILLDQFWGTKIKLSGMKIDNQAEMP